jgi:hypothetical protein
MYSFSASKASYYSGPHSKVPEPLSTFKNGKLCSAIFAMNQFNAAILPISLYTSFLDHGGFMWTIAFILSRLASIPFTNTRQPSTFPLLTLNMHFSGLSFTCALCMLVNVSARSCNWVSFVLLVTTMSSTYAKTFLSIYSLRIAFIIMQNVRPSFWTPSGILR